MRIVAFLAIIFLSIPAVGQSNLAIELSNTQSKRKIMLKAGKRIGYALVNDRGGKGRIKSITPDSMLVDERWVAVSAVKSIRKRPAAGRFFGIFFLAAGGVALAATVLPQGDPCPDCTDVSEDNGNGIILAQLGISAASLGLGIVLLENTFTRKIEGGTWNIRVVEVK